MKHVLKVFSSGAFGNKVIQVIESNIAYVWELEALNCNEWVGFLPTNIVRRFTVLIILNEKFYLKLNQNTRTYKKYFFDNSRINVHLKMLLP